MNLTIERVTVPDAVDGDAGTAFRDFVDVGNDCALRLWNDDDRVVDATDQLAAHRDSAFRLRMLYLARLDDVAVGRLTVSIPLDEDATTAQLDVQVVPVARGRGFGRALLNRGEEVVAEAGRVDVTAFTEHPFAATDEATDSLVDRSHAQLSDDPSSRFAASAGYRLGQVEVVSRLDLPVADLTVRSRDAQIAAHGAGYRIVGWSGPCPAELLDGYAAARNRIATDVPHDGLVVAAERWDADRVREEEQRGLERDEPLLVSVALHAETNDLVAYTILAVATGSPQVEQRDTLVLAAHRGHRLGTAVKLATLRALPDVAPRARRVLTWNALENCPMRAINDALGFVPYALQGQWQKRLP